MQIGRPPARTADLYTFRLTWKPHGEGSSIKANKTFLHLLNIHVPIECLRYCVVLGLFLHVGYSVTERYFLEKHSPMRFRVDNVRRKLTALLNGDSSEQVNILVVLNSRSILLTFLAQLDELFI